MPRYTVDVLVTYEVRVLVDAETEQEASIKAHDLDPKWRGGAIVDWRSRPDKAKTLWVSDDPRHRPFHDDEPQRESPSHEPEGTYDDLIREQEQMVRAAETENVWFK